MPNQTIPENNPHPHRCFHNMPEAERRKWQDPEAILQEIGLQPGHIFADIGCGEGYFTLPAARIVGEKGTVYGVDVDSESIGKLKQRVRVEKLNNVKLAVGEGETTIFCEGCVDIVFFGIVLHDFHNAGAVLLNARTMLKPGGRLVNLDWKKEETPWGPPLHIRFAENYAAGLITAAGFKVESIRLSGPYHYLIIASPVVSSKQAPN